MEEPEENNASRGVSESISTVVEHVDDRNLVDSEVISVSKEQAGGLLSDVDENCNGEDIMVEVLGSDVYVDGVCTNRIEGNLDEMGSSGDVKSPSRDAGVVDEPAIGVSDGIADEGGESIVEGVSGVGESMEETSPEVVEGGGSIVEGASGVGASIEETSQEVVEGGERDVDAMVLDNEARTDESPIVAGRTDGETEAIRVEGEDVASREAMDVEVSQVESDQVVDTEESQKTEVNPEKSKNSLTENGFEDNLVNSGGESEHLTEVASVTDGREAQVQESVEEGKQVVIAGVDTPVDLKSKKLENSDADACNPGIEIPSSSADGTETSNSQGQDATEKAPEVCSENDLKPEDISLSAGSETLLHSLERVESHIVETEREDRGSDDQSQVSGGVELPSNFLINGQKISGTEQPGLRAELKSGKVSEAAVQPLSGEIFYPTTQNVACTDSESLIEVDQRDVEADVAAANDCAMFTPNTEASVVNEHSLNVQIECRNMESHSPANGQGDIAMHAEQGKDDADDSTPADFEIVEEMGIEDNNLHEVCLHGEEEMEDVMDIYNGDDQMVKCEVLNPENFIKVLQARYQLPLENEGDFSVSDLVWGKVRSHPWWPGQIFDPSDSSEKAMRYYKKDFFLVAYFGDRTFAWNEVSQLKPFRAHFSEEEMQSNSESFQNAVECALEEVSRRSELGLACACTPREAYDMLECQVVENAGIREESSRRYGVDKSASARSFEPANLIEYIRDLAKFPSDGSDRLEIVIAKAQLTAFYRLKGYCSLPQFQFCGLPQFQFCGGLADDDLDTTGTDMQPSDFVQHAARPCQDDAQTLSGQENLKGQSSYHKRKHNLKDGLYPKKKERSLSELMDETFDNLDGENWSDGKTTSTLASPSAKKRKTVDYPIDDSNIPDGRKTISFPKVSSTVPLKQSFKIGDCIRRVASQMTGTPPIVKSNSERFQKPDGGFDGHGFESDVLLQNFDDAQRGKVNFSTEYSSLDELLSQLQLVAKDPMKEYSFSNLIASFFADFRDSIILRQHSGIEDLATDKVSGKRKTPFTSVASPETFEFEDMSDTYWTDRVIQNGTEVQPPRRTRKREDQPALVESEKSPQGSRRPYKKRHSVGNHDMSAEKFTGSVNQPSSAELIMNFSEVYSVPSEKTLNNMFRRFGPLRESETEVDREGGRARVVFKKSSDAEIAYSSAGRFNIFGPRFVNYQLNYTPTTLFKASPIPRLQDQEMHLDLSSTQFQDMQLDLASFHDHEMHLDLSSIHDQEMQLDLSTIEYHLDPNQDQENKPSFTSTQLEDMHADFSTIQYERQPDLASSHAHELQAVFTPNQEETQSVPTASQDQELQHNFTSTHLGEIQAHHALSHHDEPSVSALDQEQEMQPVFAKIKEEKIQPPLSNFHEEETQLVFAAIQEQETHDLLATAALGGIQADLAPIHHEKQIVSATAQEHEMQPVVAMIPEERQPVLATIQEQEKEIPATTQEQEKEIPATTQEHEIQPVVAVIQKESQPVLATIQEQEKEVPVTAQEQEMQPDVAMIQEEREPFFGKFQEQEKKVPATIVEQEKEVPLTTQEHEIQPVVMIQEERQPVRATIQEQENEVPATTQEHEMLPFVAMIPEERQPVLATIQEQEKEVLATTQDHEILPVVATQEKEPIVATIQGQEEEVPATSQKHEMQLVVSMQEERQPVLAEQEKEVPSTTPEHEIQPVALIQEERQPVLATIQEHEKDAVITSPIHHEEKEPVTTKEQETQPVLASIEANEMLPVLTSTQDQEIQPLTTSQELVAEPIPAMMEGQETDVCSTEAHETEHVLATTLQTTQSVTISAHEQEHMKSFVLTRNGTREGTQPILASTQELESQSDLASTEELEPDHARQGQELQSDHLTTEEQEAAPDCLTSEVQEAQSSYATGHEQDELPDDSTNEVSEMQCDSGTNQEQEMHCDGNTNQKQEMQCDNATNEDQGVQSGNATSSEQETQSDHEQEMQTDSAMNQEQEIPSNLQSDHAKKHATEEQVMQLDPITFPEPETHTDFVPTADQEMQLDHSSLDKNTV